MKTQKSKSLITTASAVLWLVAFKLLVPWQALAVGSWTDVINEPPGVAFEQMVLLSDGSVMGQDSYGETNWWQLTPDTQGSYANGRWKQLAPMHYPRYSYGKLVLRDGRVMGMGDEIDGNGATAEVYDPVSNAWTDLPPSGVGFSDSECVLLPNGDVLIAPVSWNPYPKWTMTIYSPAANSWSFPGSSLAYQDEASWVKLPDDSILSIDLDATTSERFIPSLLQWVPDANVPVAIYSGSEMGPAFLLPDGRAFFLGGTGHTVLYTPSTLGGTNYGRWAPGPDIPSGRVTADAPGAMMVNGRVLCAVAATAANGGSPAPTWFYEYNYSDLSSSTNGSFYETSSPGNPTNGSSINLPSRTFSFLALPDGTILCCNGYLNQLSVYKPDVAPLPAGKPTISNISANVPGVSYQLTGTQINGISQGAAFGDEGQDASNYPLVRMTNSASGKVYYARTYNWSSTGVMTRNA